MGKKQQKKTINLALQGGGAHGAFTWGVLDYLLEDGRIDIEGISATSAGAMNAAALAYGKTIGDAEKAREILEEFWHEISKAGVFYSPIKRNPFDLANTFGPGFGTGDNNWSINHSFAFAMFEAITRSVSPYQFNPFDVNPLRQVLEKILDFKEVHACECVKLFISATEVASGTAKIFRNDKIDVETLMASAALPFLFQAVEIDDKHYWDGGYMGNPALWPLFYETKARDILIVHVNPIKRPELPTQAYEIQNRMNEITFNASLIKDIRSIAFVKKLLENDMLKEEFKDHYKDILLHAIRTDDVMLDFSTASKFNTDWLFLQYLRDLGREEAATWLKSHFKDIGKKTTVDIEKDYLSQD